MSKGRRRHRRGKHYRLGKKAPKISVTWGPVRSYFASDLDDPGYVAYLERQAEVERDAESASNDLDAAGGVAEPPPGRPSPEAGSRGL